MGSNWQREEDVTTTPAEVQAMASVLEGRHGLYAAEIAEFFSDLHGHKGDVDRSWIWAGVADTVRRRQWARIEAA
ncbi:MAG TPA: hypothetical protein VE665_02090 [Hyphomicrobiaceae bacterium]|jgi:hypothetical protein|nr:hypothetical protein [Hyphomicrobiaceae bacterium]